VFFIVLNSWFLLNFSSLVNVNAFFLHLYHKHFSLKKKESIIFTFYHNLSNINLSPLVYLKKKLYSQITIITMQNITKLILL